MFQRLEDVEKRYEELNGLREKYDEKSKEFETLNLTYNELLTEKEEEFSLRKKLSLSFKISKLKLE